MLYEIKKMWSEIKKSVFFARLKRWAACLWPTSGRRQILRLSLLKKQGLSSTPSREKTVLIRVENKFSEICGWESFNQKCLPCEAHRAKKGTNYAKRTQFSEH